MGAPPKPSVSGFGGERRSKEAGEEYPGGVFRDEADFATTRAIPLCIWAARLSSICTNL